MYTQQHETDYDSCVNTYTESNVQACSGWGAYRGARPELRNAINDMSDR